MVKDTGIGISKQDQKKLFRLFGYVSNQEGVNVNGIGLGLVISKKIVEQFGGRITMKSELGKGSEFCFYLKLYED